jgi:hypothetical protein
MPTTLLTPPTLERVLQGLHDSEIRCGIQNEPPAGGITAWIDYGSRTEKATFYGTIVGCNTEAPTEFCRLSKAAIQTTCVFG